MTALAALAACLAASLVAAAPPGAKALQPPMNSFDFAFYVCDDGRAFQISYDSDAPKTATLTTSDKNKQYVLTRKPDPEGAEFTNGGARFWTNGRKVVVEGTASHLENCKRQAN